MPSKSSMLRPAVLLIAIATIVCPPARAGEKQAAHGPVPTLNAVRAQAAVTIDGRLDDEVWLRAPAGNRFHPARTRRRPTRHGTHRAAYRLRRRRAVRRRPAARPRAGRIARQLVAPRQPTPRRTASRSILDPHHDHLTGACFRVTAAGVQSDAIVYNDIVGRRLVGRGVGVGGHVDEDGLDAWRCASRSRSCGFRRPSATRSGINAMRYIQRKNERRGSCYVPKNESGLASRMAHLDGLDGHLAAPAPRAAAVRRRPRRVHRASSRRSVQRRRRARSRGAGVDLKYGLSSNLTLDATVNPDFGQVEVDPAVVNLSAFETFFEEKRPFFIEGAQDLQQLRADRREQLLGLQPLRADHLLLAPHRPRAAGRRATGDFVDTPDGDDDPRRGEAHGQDAQRLDPRPARRGHRARDARTVDGRRRQRRRRSSRSPTTSSARVQREIGRAAAIGVLATAVNRDLARPRFATTCCRRSAYVVGVDGALLPRQPSATG